MSSIDVVTTLGSIHTDLGYLLDVGVLTEDTYNDITAKLPRRYKPNTSQATTSQPSSQPVSTIAPTQAAAPAATPVHSAPNTNAPPAYPASSQVEAMYAYTGTSHDDLSFKQGDRITVTEYINSDWWRGQLNGNSGIFPSNYVRQVKESPQEGLEKVEYEQVQRYPQLPPNEYNPQQYTSVQYAVPPPQQGQQGQPPEPVAVVKNKFSGTLHRLPGKFGNAMVFGAGATLGSDLINSIF